MGSVRGNETNLSLKKRKRGGVEICLLDIILKIRTGYLYHISSDFLKLVDDPNLQINHMGNQSRL